MKIFKKHYKNPEPKKERLFRFEAIDITGEVWFGESLADNETHLAEMMRENGLFLQKITFDEDKGIVRNFFNKLLGKKNGKPNDRFWDS